MSTLLERLGGTEGIQALVDAAYEKIIHQEELKPFFEHANTTNIRRMQYVFLEAALSEETTLQDSGISISQAHHGLEIQRKHFEMFVNCFLDALQEAKVIEDDDIDLVIGKLNTYVDEVIGTSTTDG